MSPLAKYGTIVILSVVAVLVAWQVWKVLAPAPEGKQEFFNELCKSNPNDSRCKQ